MFRNATARTLTRATRPAAVQPADEQATITTRRRPARRNVEQAAIRASLLGMTL
jgi:hypothetical protein